jgi:Double zinc ribbon
MSIASSLTCPSCGAGAAGNFCSNCGASLVSRACAACRAELSPRARFCHRCGTSVASRPRLTASERQAWIIAGALCVLLVGGIAYQVSSSAPEPATPDMANPGVPQESRGDRPRPLSGPAPDISGMTPRERFDRLYNRIMQAAERRDSAEVARFTPMALGAYEQLDTRDSDARYHAAVLQVQVGNTRAAKALADTILAQTPGHLFGYIIRGTAAEVENDSISRARAQREFLSRYAGERASNRVEYLEHAPVLEEFRKEAEKREQ